MQTPTMDPRMSAGAQRAGHAPRRTHSPLGIAVLLAVVALALALRSWWVL